MDLKNMKVYPTCILVIKSVYPFHLQLGHEVGQAGQPV